MIPKVNYHTHTIFCDGRDNAEDCIKEAIEKCFTAIGFSGHSYTPMDLSYCMTLEGTKLYCEEINRLKEKYKEKIRIYCGIELDYYSDIDATCYDYIIGSVHYLLKDGIYYPIDDTIEAFEKAIRAYDGDAYALVEAYFENVSNVVDKTNCNIVGHFDLVRKFNDGGKYFSEEDPRYINASEKAIRKLLKKNVIFELNTGAVCSGYLKEPYPLKRILKIIAEENGRVVLSSDAHAKENIDYYFKEAGELLAQFKIEQVYSF